MHNGKELEAHEVEKGRLKCSVVHHKSGVLDPNRQGW